MELCEISQIKEPYRDMHYTLSRHDPVLLYRGSYKGYEFCCVSHGTHPCAYVAVAKGQPYYDATDYDEVSDLNCHGGCTYVAGGFWNQFSEDLTVLGWDYAHTGDFYGSYYTDTFRQQLKKWTTTEIVLECYKVIDQLYAREHSLIYYK